MAKDYEIGFKKPPKKTQFKKGATGNPKGRPKEVKNLKSVVRDEAYSKVVIKEDGKTRTVTKLEALIKRTMAKGLQGDNKAASTALALLQEYLPSYRSRGCQARSPQRAGFEDSLQPRGFP